MKKILSIILSALFIVSLCSCKSDRDGTDVKKGNEKIVYTIDCEGENPATDPEVAKKAEELLKEIENNPDTVKAEDGHKTYYVSNSGSNTNDGLSKDKPVDTVDTLASVLEEGDCVLFERGGLWRGGFTCTEGVKYGAYGEGEKPAIYGAVKNSVEDNWYESDDENIYICRGSFSADVGLIVVNHGEKAGSRKWEKEDLKEDLDFYMDSATRLLYVYSENGNPKDLYYDIEVCVAKHVISAKSGNTIQNLRIMYGGAHGIGMGSVKNVVIDGCIVGYIGGANQGGTVGQTRYGNGIEVWGTCDGFTINKCHVYQCYDAGITMQFISQNENVGNEQNIHFTSNLLEYSVYNIEYFYDCAKDPNAKMKDVEIKDNIIQFGGYGWGYRSRSNKNNGTNIMGVGTDNRTENFVFTNNIINNAKSMLLNISAVDEQYLPEFTGNIFSLPKSSRICKVMGKNYGYDKYGETAVTETLADKEGKLIAY